MRTICVTHLLCCAAFATSLDALAAQAAPADSVYLNGRIYTVDDQRSWIEAAAVKDGRFTTLGVNADIAPLIGPETKVVDLEGNMAMPSLYDLHIHPLEAGTKALFECGFSATLTIDAILDRVKSCAEAKTDNGWIRGGSWGTELLEATHAPDKTMLDAVAPDNPVFLIDSAHHNAWVNSKALEVLQINDKTTDPEGGIIVRDAASGEPTGLLMENAAYQVMNGLPPLTPAQYEEAMAFIIADLNRFGITGIKDALASDHAMQAYRALAARNELNANVATSLPWRFAWLPAEQMTAGITGRGQYKSNRVHVDFIKIMLDGIPPSRTAVFVKPYTPDETHGDDFHGELHVPADELAQDLIAFDREGLTVKIHATGDGSVRVALDAIAAARKANGNSGLRHEISHAGYIQVDDYPRFKHLNAVAELSPAFWYPHPMVIAMGEVLGNARARRMFPIRSLKEAEATLIYGSDYPVVYSANPWLGIEAMVTRRAPGGGSDDALWPEEAIDVKTAVDILTRNGAQGLRLAKDTGSIEVGKSADLIVLDRNIFTVPSEQIGETKVLMTILAGELIYQR